MPRNLLSLSSPRYLALAPVAMIRVSKKSCEPSLRVMDLFSKSQLCALPLMKVVPRLRAWARMSIMSC